MSVGNLIATRGHQHHQLTKTILSQIWIEKMALALVEDKNIQEQPHLVQLVLASKKALQHGEQLCSKARSISVLSAQTAVDVLALDAKVRWITSAVTEQLKVRKPCIVPVPSV